MEENIIPPNTNEVIQKPKKNILGVIISIIVTALLVGCGVYFWQDYSKKMNEEKLKNEISKLNTDLTQNMTSQKDLQTQVEELKTQIEEMNKNQDYATGKTIIISKSTAPINCSKNGKPCENIWVTTEVDLTEQSTEDKLTGKFFIRAYNGNDYANKIGESILVQNYNPFEGKDPNIPKEEPKEIMTLLASDKSSLESKFNLTYSESVPGWDIPGYTVKIENEGGKSKLDGRYVDFLYDGKEVKISFPQ